MVRWRCLEAESLDAGTWHEASDLRSAICVLVRPHYSRTEAVGFGHDSRVRYDKPLSMKSYTIVSIQCVPVDILHTDAVGKRAAQAPSTREPIEPLFEWRIVEPTIVTCKQEFWSEHTDAHC